MYTLMEKQSVSLFFSLCVHDNFVMDWPIPSQAHKDAHRMLKDSKPSFKNIFLRLSRAYEVLPERKGGNRTGRMLASNVSTLPDSTLGRE